MNRLTLGVAIALLLAGCPAQGDGDKAPPSEAEVEAGTTKDSADPRLNALQRTKRTLGKIETERKNATNAADPE